MTTVSPILAVARRSSLGLPLAGLALVAGLGLATAPAAAASNSWQASCQFKSIPGSGGEGQRYDSCLRLETCQRMANAAGHTIFSFEAGCFGMEPDAAALHPWSRPTR